MTTRLLGLVLLAACAAGGEGGDLERLEQAQIDCTPVCDPQCFDAWNARACCSRPPECALEQVDDGETEPPSP